MNSLVRFLASILSCLRPASRIHPLKYGEDRKEDRSNRALSLEEEGRLNKGTITYFFPSIHP